MTDIALRAQYRLGMIARHGARPAKCPACGIQYETHKGSTRPTARCIPCEALAIELKQRSHRLVARAISRGELVHPTTLKCKDCGIQAWQYDHRDYHQPLVVEPVCAGCNIRRGPAAPFLRVA